MFTHKTIVLFCGVFIASVWADSDDTEKNLTNRHVFYGCTATEECCAFHVSHKFTFHNNDIELGCKKTCPPETERAPRNVCRHLERPLHNDDNAMLLDIFRSLFPSRLQDIEDN